MQLIALVQLVEPEMPDNLHLIKLGSGLSVETPIG
jgi:hypothetical protein